MRLPVIGPVVVTLIISLAVFAGFEVGIGGQGNAQAEESRDRDRDKNRDRDRDREGQGTRLSENDRQINTHAEQMVERGKQIFRFDTYGSEAFFGDALQLHKAIAGEKNGGV